MWLLLEYVWRLYLGLFLGGGGGGAGGERMVNDDLGTMIEKNSMRGKCFEMSLDHTHFWWNTPLFRSKTSVLKENTLLISSTILQPKLFWGKLLPSLSVYKPCIFRTRTLGQIFKCPFFTWPSFKWKTNFVVRDVYVLAWPVGAKLTSISLG